METVTLSTSTDEKCASPKQQFPSEVTVPFEGAYPIMLNFSVYERAELDRLGVSSKDVPNILSAIHYNWPFPSSKDEEELLRRCMKRALYSAIGYVPEFLRKHGIKHKDELFGAELSVKNALWVTPFQQRDRTRFGGSFVARIARASEPNSITVEAENIRMRGIEGIPMGGLVVLDQESTVCSVSRKSINIPVEYLDAEDLPRDEKRIYSAAREATKGSHSPYSHFRVGAAVLLNDGEIVKGSNQENASYGLTVCAERTALFTVGAMERKRDVRKLAVTGVGRDFETVEPVMPCGACRQVIKEYEDLARQKVVLIMSGWKGKVARMKGIDSLLPMGFGPADFGADQEG